MQNFTIIVKNNSGSDVAINDLGILSVPDGGQRDLTASFEPSKIVASSDLQSLVNAGTLVINDGTSDLSSSDGLDLITLQTLKHLKDNYYSKADLTSADSGAQISYTNLVDKPAHGTAAGFYRPAEILALGVGLSTPPSSPSQHDAYVDASGNLQIYDGSGWNVHISASGTVVNAGLSNEKADGTRVIDLTNHTIKEFDGTTWRNAAALNDNYAIIVNRYKGKEAQFMYSSETTEFVFYTFMDFSGLFDGGASKFDADQIDVEGTYTNLSGSDVETVIGEIDTALSDQASTTSTHTLDKAYDAGGAGAGRLITADTGAVVFDTDTATNAALQITPKASLPSTGLADGQFAIKDGIKCIYDASKATWLSTYRKEKTFSKDGYTQNINLNVSGVSHNNAGARISRTSKITGISCQLTESGTCTVRLRKNNSVSDIATLDLTAVTGNHDNAVNVGLSAGDHLQVYIESVAGVQNPIVTVELAEIP